MNGIVKLEDLPQREIYVGLDKSSVQILKEKIKETKNISRFLRNNKLTHQNFWDWWIGKSAIRLDIFLSISRALKLNIEINKIRGKQGVFIYQPKIPFDFTSDSGIRLIASILGDGCIHDNGIRYSNSDKQLANLFISDAQNVFGTLKYRIHRDNAGVYIIDLPEICKKIILHTGLKSGSKILNAQKIPGYIFKMDKSKTSKFISKLIDDEGYFSNGRFGIDMAFSYDGKPYILLGMRKLLKSLDINSKIFKTNRPYISSRGKNRQMWRLAIFNYSELEKLCSLIELHHSKKLFLAKEILKKKRKLVIKGIRPYLILMKKIEKDNGFFTLSDLALASNKSERQIYRVLLKAQKDRLIRSLENRSVAHSKCVVSK